LKNFVHLVPPHRLLVKCKYCSHTCWSGVARMKHHLAGTKENVIPCVFVLDDVKKAFLKLLEDKEKIKEANRQDCLKEVDIQDNKNETLESFVRKGKGVIK